MISQGIWRRALQLSRKIGGLRGELIQPKNSYQVKKTHNKNNKVGKKNVDNVPMEGNQFGSLLDFYY